MLERSQVAEDGLLSPVTDITFSDSPPSRPRDPRIVLVHDYVTQRGGAERVVLDLLRSFPGARLVTACFEAKATYPRFAEYDIETLWPNRFPMFRQDPRTAFPFLAKAFSRHVISDADLVICSSSGWAHRVTTSAPKIVYCHNPARWLYQPDDYFADLPHWIRRGQRGFVAAMSGLRHSDAIAAQRCSRYLGNSAAVVQRIRDTYGIEATILPPSRGISPTGPATPVAGIEPGFLLTIGRERGYKHTESICQAVASMKGERLVAVGAQPAEAYEPQITRLRNLSDENMRWLYANASGLVAVAHEDFGLAPVEAQAFGLPTVVLRAGGYLDTTVENVTGVFVDGTSPALIADAIANLRSRTWDSVAIRRCGEQFSREAFTDRITRIADKELGRVGVVKATRSTVALGTYTRSNSTPHSPGARRGVHSAGHSPGGNRDRAHAGDHSGPGRVEGYPAKEPAAAGRQAVDRVDDRAGPGH